MVSMKNKLVSNKIGVILSCELHHCQKFPSCDTVSCFSPRKSSTAISHSFMSLIILLREDCSNSHITRISAQDEVSNGGKVSYKLAIVAGQPKELLISCLDVGLGQEETLSVFFRSVVMPRLEIRWPKVLHLTLEEGTTSTALDAAQIQGVSG